MSYERASLGAQAAVDAGATAKLTTTPISLTKTAFSITNPPATEPTYLTAFRSRCATQKGEFRQLTPSAYSSADTLLAARQRLVNDKCVQLGVGSGDRAGTTYYCCSIPVEYGMPDPNSGPPGDVEKVNEKQEKVVEEQVQEVVEEVIEEETGEPAHASMSLPRKLLLPAVGIALGAVLWYALRRKS